MNDWVPIRYLSFWDVPRHFLVEYAGEWLLFDSPFDEDLEDYTDAYTVYRLAKMTQAEMDSDLTAPGLARKSVGILGQVPIAQIRFDPTKRKQIGSEIFSTLPVSKSNGVSPHAPIGSPVS